MGNQELLEYFSIYAAVKARHSYGPHGHRGMSVLIFEAIALGYLEAERLHNHFVEQGTDREAWERCRVLFSQGAKRQLYGYLATKEDMEIFNQHSQGMVLHLDLLFGSCSRGNLFSNSGAPLAPDPDADLVAPGGTCKTVRTQRMLWGLPSAEYPLMPKLVEIHSKQM